MTKPTDKDPKAEADKGPEEISEEALDQADGGFTLSGVFQPTTNTFNTVNIQDTTSIETSLQGQDVDTVAALRRRPGRFGPV